MFSIKLHQSVRTAMIIAAVSMLNFSCQKEISGDGAITPPIAVDLATKVIASTSGFVTDENNAPVIGASVKAGIVTVTTDKYGYFEINNAEVVKNAAVVTITKSGYFKNIKTFIATAGKSTFLRVKMIPKASAGTLSATAGGSVSLTSGLKLTFPAASVVNASTNAAYTGTIHVSAAWLDPTATDLNSIMPGDLRGIDASGNMQGLTTYGMTAVELTGDAGEMLQVAAGKKVAIEFPVPASIAGTAPVTIPLWSFNEENGLWKEEGSATKTGNKYVGDVSHFTYWNCDIPGPIVQMTVRFVDGAGRGIANASVTIVKAGTTYGGAAHGYTDTSGYIIGPVPANSNLVLTLASGNFCNTNIHTQTFTTTTANINLGTVVIDSIQSLATVSGSLLNCNNLPVTNGYVIGKIGYYYFRYPVNSAGVYTFSTILCNGSQTMTYVAEDLGNMQQSQELTVSLHPGVNSIPPIQACGISTQQFFNYTINGTNYSFTAPADSLIFRPNYNGTNQTDFYLSANQGVGTNYAVIFFTGAGIGVGSSQPLIRMQSTQLPDSTTITVPINVNITEYGPNNGQFTSGNFSGVVTGYPTPTVFNISGSFRARKYF